MKTQEKQQLVNNHITTASALLFPESKLALFYSPKAGATSLINWYHFQKDLIQFQIDPEIRNNAGNTELMIAYQSSRYYQQALIDLKESILKGSDGDWTTIKLVRDPYRRGISAFYMVLLLTGGELSIREFFKLPLSYFTTFGDGHCFPQVTKLERLNILKFNRIIKLENNLEIELGKLENEFGLKKSPPTINLHANKRTIRNKFNDTLLAVDKVYSAKDLQKKVPVPSFALLSKDDDLLASIYAKYKDDFSHYGYQLKHSNEALERYYAEEGQFVTSRMKAFFNNNANKSLKELVSEFSSEDRIIIYGAGQIMFELIFLSGLKHKKIVAILETNPEIIARWNNFFLLNMKIPILNPKKINTLEFDKIIITPIGEAIGIRNKLLSQNINQKKIILLPEVYL